MAIIPLSGMWPWLLFLCQACGHGVKDSFSFFDIILVMIDNEIIYSNIGKLGGGGLATF